jgi:signal transduction histidine kinase
MTSQVSRLTPDELRTLFLFERLDDDQLAWLAENGRVEQVPVGPIYTEGEDATCFYVLLDGEVSMSRRVGTDDIEVNRTSYRGVYAGATQAYLGERFPQKYVNSLRATAPSTLFLLPAQEWATAIREWFPMAIHLLEGLFFGIQSTNRLVGQRERLLALGSLSAGLTHELNNPAAAAVRATAALRERVAGMRHKLGYLADGHVPADALHQLVELQEAAVERAAKAAPLGGLEAADSEDEVGDWLEDHGIQRAFDIAPVLVSAGLDVAWLDEIAAAVGPDMLESAVHWLAYAVETENLMGEIEDATTRISTLVGKAKQYSQMDRAPHQDIDIHDGLESTLIMLGSKIGDGIRVVKDYDETLPAIPAYGAELNQVWTNIIDNAVAAMEGMGTLTLRTRRGGDDADPRLIVEVTDTGPGMSADVLARIFEPFFTTKPVGEGTGLGLDISWRIVVNRHGGDIRVRSKPGETTFVVTLPMTGPRPSERRPVDDNPEARDEDSDR